MSCPNVPERAQFSTTVRQPCLEQVTFSRTEPAAAQDALSILFDAAILGDLRSPQVGRSCERK